MAWLYSLSVPSLLVLPDSLRGEPNFHLDSEAEWRGGVGRSSFLDLPRVSSAVEDSCGFLKQEIALGKPEEKLLALQNPQNFYAGCKRNLCKSLGGSWGVRCLVGTYFLLGMRERFPLRLQWREAGLAETPRVRPRPIPPVLGEAHWLKPPTLARHHSNYLHELFYDRKSW